MASSYDDLLNGGGAAPAYAMPVPTSLPTEPKDGAVDAAARGAGNVASSRAIMLAWFLIFALLVASHVLTLSVQK